MRRLSTLLMLAALTPCVALAQSARSPSGNNQMLQQLAAERTQLQADNAKLKGELETLKKEHESLKKSSEAAAKRLQGGGAAAARANARADQLQTELDRTKGQLAEVVSKYREMAGTLREVETDRASVRNDLSQRDLAFKQCVDRNLSLYQLNGEILTRLEHRGSFTPASALEPFTRLKRVQLENLIDGYQSRADEQFILKAVPPPSGR